MIPLTIFVLAFLSTQATACPKLDIYNQAFNDLVKQTKRYFDGRFPDTVQRNWKVDNCNSNAGKPSTQDIEATFSGAWMVPRGECRLNTTTCQASCPFMIDNLKARIGPKGNQIYNLRLTIEDNLVVKIYDQMEIPLTSATVKEPFLKSPKLTLSPEGNNGAGQAYVQSLCTEELVKEVRENILTKDWVSQTYNSFVEQNGHVAENTICLNSVNKAVETATCLDNQVSGRYLKCVRDTVGWTTVTWEQIFRMSCKKDPNANIEDIKDCQDEFMNGSKPKWWVWSCVQGVARG